MLDTPYALKTAVIGTFPPRKCGIATFTSDVEESLRNAGCETVVVAMNDQLAPYAYDNRVCAQVDAADIHSYVQAARFLNSQQVDVISVQHEFGIFGGPAGEYLLTLLRNVSAPIVTTLHTILEEPNEDQRRVMEELIQLSQKIMVMSKKGREILVRTFGVDSRSVEVIPHGCPVVLPTDRNELKRQLGLEGRNVILTFGLLSQDKGIETAIKAMPGIVKRHPNTTYVVLGATHPHILRDSGDAYRNNLVQLTQQLGVEKNVQFEDRFVSLEDLVQYLQTADIYLTPYLNPKQITSGTLAYAFGSGKAIVSTPYWHADELLKHGQGRLVPFGDSKAIEHVIADLLDHPEVREKIEARAFAESRETTWPVIGQKICACFSRAIEENNSQLHKLLLPSVPKEHFPLSVPLPVALMDRKQKSPLALPGRATAMSVVSSLLP